MSKTPSAQAPIEPPRKPPGVAPPDAPAPATFAAKQIDAPQITVRGPAWAEYHLLTVAPTPEQPFARIVSEAHAPGGSPLVAFLLARWCEEEDSSCIVRLHLETGSGPNGRLLRREIEKRVSNFPNLRVEFESSAGATETYRILHWACEHTGAALQVSGSTPQVLQHGEIGAAYEVEHAGGKYLQAPREAWDDAVGIAARAWATHCGVGEAVDLWARGAARAWGAQVLARRWECALNWGEVAAEIRSLKDEEEAGEKVR
jgi:hypothetical protein